MKGIDIYNLLYEVRNNFCSDKRFSYISLFRFNDNISYFESSTKTDDYMKNISIDIGTKGLNTDEEYSDYEAMIPIVGIFHEIAHASQIHDRFKKSDKLSKVLAVNYLAGQCSREYYYGPNLQNYYKQSYEIAAQFVGLHMAQSFCSYRFGNETAEKLIINYVNNRIEADSGYIKFKHNKPYTSLEDIYDAFDEAFVKSTTQHRKFDAKRANNGFDTYSDYIRSHDISNMFYLSNFASGLRQDVILSAIYVAEVDVNDVLKNNVPAIENITVSDSLNPLHNISWIKPTKQELKLIELIQDMDYSDGQYSDDIDYFDEI